MVRQLGERLGPPNAHPDRDTCAAQYLSADPPAEHFDVWHTGKVGKRLVDLKERRTAMDMISAQTFRYSISDAGCP